MIRGVLLQRCLARTGLTVCIHRNLPQQRCKHALQLVRTVDVEPRRLLRPSPHRPFSLDAQVQRTIRFTGQLGIRRQRLIQRNDELTSQSLVVLPQLVQQRLQALPIKRQPGAPQLRHRRQRRTLQIPRLMQPTIRHPVLDRLIQLHQQLHVIRRIGDLLNPQLWCAPVAGLLLLADLLAQVSLHHRLQTIPDVGQPVGEHPTGEHRAEHLPPGIQPMLLEPPQIKHSVVGHPLPLGVEELPQHVPVAILQIPAVDDDGHRIKRVELQQPQPPEHRLQPSRLTVKEHRVRLSQPRQVLQPLQIIHCLV